MAVAKGVASPVFVPPTVPEFYEITRSAYLAARAEAARIATGKRIKVRVEALKPTHIGLTQYKLPTGDQTFTLKTNTAIFPYGILNRDSSFDYMKWWEGNKTRYIGDWFTLPVYYFAEFKQGAYKGNLENYAFRGDETFTFNCHSTTTPTPTTVDAWLLAFVVIPETMAETAVTQ